MRLKHSVSLAILLFLLNFFLCSLVIAETHDQKNLIVEEMTALDAAFKKTVDAVIFNKPENIVTAYDEFKKIRLEANAALKDGKITLSRNQNLFKRFVHFDKRFQRETAKLIRAAEKNNMTIIKMQTSKTLSLCSQCHKIFRDGTQP
jgi:GTPase involved in cell partitioning and DNA repair